MGKRKSKRTRMLQRIAALPYNPYFKEVVNGIRRKYAIPSEAQEAIRWFVRYSRQHGRRAFQPPIPSTYDALVHGLFQKGELAVRRFQKGEHAVQGGDLVTLELIHPDIREVGLGPERVEDIHDTEVPLEQDVLTILEFFKIPSAAFYDVMNHILMGAELWGTGYWSALHIQVHLRRETMQPDGTVTISGLAPWTKRPNGNGYGMNA